MVDGYSKYPFVLMSTGDGRRTTSNTFWGAEKTAYFDNFSDTIALQSNLTTVTENFGLSLSNYALAKTI